MSAKEGRSYEKRFEVTAPTEAVWKAITEAEELTRWFCNEASCEAGDGGHQQIDWGGGAKATQIVTVWEPGIHLRTEAIRPGMGGGMSADPPEPYAIDWHLEQKGGVSRVRMVASGFGEGPDWDHEYHGTFHGWDMYHGVMKHYLEHHRGEAAGNVVIYAVLAVPPAEAWARLMSPDGLVKQGSLDGLSAGAPFRIVTSQSHALTGTVRGIVPAKTFSALVDSLNKAILNLELTSVPGRGDFLYFALLTWGLPQAQVNFLREQFKALLYGLFPQATETPDTDCAVAESKPAGAQMG